MSNGVYILGTNLIYVWNNFDISAAGFIYVEQSLFKRNRVDICGTGLIFVEES